MQIFFSIHWNKVCSVHKLPTYDYISWVIHTEPAWILYFHGLFFVVEIQHIPLLCSTSLQAWQMKKKTATTTGICSVTQQIKIILLIDNFYFAITQNISSFAGFRVQLFILYFLQRQMRKVFSFNFQNEIPSRNHAMLWPYPVFVVNSSAAP